MTTSTETLGDALPKEMARVRVVLGHYHELGNVGAIAAWLIEEDLRVADLAVMSGDVVQMLKAYEKLKGIKE